MAATTIVQVAENVNGEDSASFSSPGAPEASRKGRQILPACQLTQ